MATTNDLEGSITLELQSATTQLTCEHGDPSPTDDDLPENGDSIRVRWSARWVDRGMALDEDPPARFEREFDRLELKLSRTGRNLTGAATVTVESVLERTLLAYTWNESSNEFECRPRIPDSPALRDAAETLGSACVWSPILDPRESPSDSSWRIDAEGLLRSLWPGGFGDLRYGERGTTTATWQQVHIAVIPELPPYVDLWMEGATGRARADLAATSDASAHAANVTVDIEGRIPLDVLLHRISENHSMPQSYWETLNIAGERNPLDAERHVQAELDGWRTLHAASPLSRRGRDSLRPRMVVSLGGSASGDVSRRTFGDVERTVGRRAAFRMRSTLKPLGPHFHTACLLGAA